MDISGFPMPDVNVIGIVHAVISILRQFPLDVRAKSAKS